jgi:hypothetical protein
MSRSPISNWRLVGAPRPTVSEIATSPRYSRLIPGVPDGPPGNVGQLYAKFAKDLHEGTHVVPDFNHAVSQHRLLDAIQTASETGITQTLD